jgi:hypothetical protein
MYINGASFLLFSAFCIFFSLDLLVSDMEMVMLIY